MRSGVPSSPSRSGSSPAQRIKVRTASSASARVGRRTRFTTRERGFGAANGGATTCDILVLSKSGGSPRSGLAPQSVEPDLLMRAVERKSGNLNREAFAAPRLHLISADHDAGRGRQRCAAGVLEGFARTQNGLLTD